MPLTLCNIKSKLNGGGKSIVFLISPTLRDTQSCAPSLSCVLIILLVHQLGGTGICGKHILIKDFFVLFNRARTSNELDFAKDVQETQ